MHFNNPTQQKMKIKNMTTLHSRKSIGRSLSWRCGFVLTLLALAYFALVQNTQAACLNPDGGCPGANTAEGDNALASLGAGIANTAVGFNALTSNTTGGWNVAIGSSALASNTTGNFNMAVGTDALRNNTANFNLAIGFRVGFMNTTGNHLTGIGAGALFSNTTGSRNTAIGADALHTSTTGEENTAIGAAALRLNIDGASNTAVGHDALSDNTTGDGNVAVGDEALSQNKDAGNDTTSINGPNTAIGFEALEQATTDPITTRVGDANAAVGWQALQNNTTGQGNTGVGSLALQAENGATSDRNTAVGRRALEFLVSGSDNTAVGWRAGDNVTTANGVICIGSFATGANVDNTTYIGNIGSSANSSQPFVGGVDFVTVNLTTNKLGHLSSSRRYKEDVKPMDNASEILYRLRPVTYRYKKDIDPAQTLDYGLVAEDVAKVDSKLAIRGKDGQIESVRYLTIYNMMLNEFLKEHKKVQELEATVAQQQKGMEVLTAQLKEQAAQIQKVSAQLEVSKPAPQMVANH
jgi:hypothetical protein